MGKLEQETNVSVQSAHRAISEAVKLREGRNHKLLTLDYTGNPTQRWTTSAKETNSVYRNEDIISNIVCNNGK